MSSTQLLRSDATLTVADLLINIFDDVEATSHVESRDWTSYIALPTPSILDPDFVSKYQARELLSKYPFDIGVDREAVALEKWRRAELDCAAFNSIAPWITQPYGAPPAIVSRLRRKMREILGRFRWKDAVEFCGFGPGSTTSLKRTHGHFYHKLGLRPDVTPSCYPLARAVLRTSFPLWYRDICARAENGPVYHLVRARNKDDRDLRFQAGVRIVEGSTLTTVPKNAKTDRVICKEPDLNMFLQKGIGGLIRARLRKSGLDLNQQQPLNREMTRTAVSRGLATIDLQSASDSIAMGLCELILPPCWLRAIRMTRSGWSVLPDGTRVPLEKVASMGNGFCFELESVIFYALLLVTVPDATNGLNIACYGDDLICPSTSATALARNLDVLGFRLNYDKSFVEGPFRESCGIHVYNDVEITPLYIRKPVDTVYRVFFLLNRLSWFASRENGGYRDSKYRPTWEALRRVLPRRLRAIYGPRGPEVDQFGHAINGARNDCIVSCREAAMPRRAADGWDGWDYLHSVDLERSRDMTGSSALSASLYQLDRLKRGAEYRPGLPLPARNSTVTSGFTPLWLGFGDWLP